MITISDISARIAGRLLLDHASVSLPSGTKAGLVGRNGAGKSTLFRVISGDLGAESGTISIPKNARIGEFTEAGSNAYNALVVGHLEKFKRYPKDAHGASGTVLVRFALNRAGDVILSEVSKSSGNNVLDHEALDILHRASPFPPFPAAKPGAQESYIWPMHFAR